jgi:hypothetical protein
LIPTLYPCFENDGRIALLGVTRDVTARKQAEAELERYQKQLEELVAERTAALMETVARASHIRSPAPMVCTVSIQRGDYFHQPGSLQDAWIH